MPLRHIPLVDSASFTIQNTLWRNLENNKFLFFVRKAKIMENTMWHECCKIGSVPMTSMFLWYVVPWCLEAFVLSKFCYTLFLSYLKFGGSFLTGFQFWNWCHFCMLLTIVGASENNNLLWFLEIYLFQHLRFHRHLPCLLAFVNFEILPFYTLV